MAPVPVLVGSCSCSSFSTHFIVAIGLLLHVCAETDPLGEAVKVDSDL